MSEVTKPITVVCLSYNGKNYFIEWGCIVKAPLSMGMGKDEFIEAMKHKYAKNKTAIKNLKSDIEAAEANGSNTNLPLEELLVNNKAGVRNGYMNINDIVKYYCVAKSLPY